MKLTNVTLSLVLLSATLGLSACSAEVKTPAAPTVTESVDTSAAKGGSRSHEVTIRATVESVDLKKRSVTLKGFDGTRETIHVSEQVKNLPQLKRGDEVIVSYFQSVAFKVVDKKDAKLGVAGMSGQITAEPGEKPGAAEGTTMIIVADILKIDRKNQIVELRTDKGEIHSVEVERPEVFDKIKVGNRVAIQVTEAVAVDVQQAK